MKEKSWEYIGKTVAEAIEIALEELGLERDDIHVEVLHEPQKGFLGLGGKEARIRVDLIGEWEVQGKKREETEKRESEEVREYKEEEEREEGAALIGDIEKPMQIVKEVLKLIDIEATVEAKEKEESVVVDVWGDDVAILIGKGGATLDALQYLVNIGCRRKGEVGKKIVIDAEGYRKRRNARLEKQAEQLAEKAISQRKSLQMPPMSASERKTIHMALREYEGVWTESEGEEPNRYVVIYPGVERST